MTRAQQADPTTGAQPPDLATGTQPPEPETRAQPPDLATGAQPPGQFHRNDFGASINTSVGNHPFSPLFQTVLQGLSFFSLGWLSSANAYLRNKLASSPGATVLL